MGELRRAAAFGYLFLLSLTYLAWGPNVTQAGPVSALVPAYFYPGTGGPGGSGDGWAAMTAAAGQVGVTAIFNPNSGPLPGPADPNYINAFTNLENAGGKVVAYVATGYAMVPLATVEGQIGTYRSQYGSQIDGFFLDLMTNDNSPSDVAYYHNLYTYIKSLDASYQVIGNPGASTVPAYLTAGTQGADVLVTVENSAGNYPSLVPPSWVFGFPPSHFANIVYDQPTVAGMKADLSLAVQRNVGSVYVTDQPLNPPTGYLYDQLPSYWDQEVGALAALPEPSGWVLFLLGFVACFAGWSILKRNGKTGVRLLVKR
jgi:hypothetical protein